MTVYVRPVCKWQCMWDLCVCDSVCETCVYVTVYVRPVCKWQCMWDLCVSDSVCETCVYVTVYVRPACMWQCMWDLCVAAMMTVRCCLGVDDTLAAVLWFNATLLDADRLCTDDSSLVLLQHQYINANVTYAKTPTHSQLNLSDKNWN